MKKRLLFVLFSSIILCLLFNFSTVIVSATDQIIQSTEEMVGAGHATKADTLNRAFIIEHSADGKHQFSDGEGMLDNNGNEIITYNVVGSAVNYVELGNAAANGDVTIQGLGSDSNVNVSLTGKGSGVVRATLTGYAAIRTNCIIYSDANTITIPGNCIEVDGKLCWWDATLTFDLGSGGSNAASTNLGANEWHYIYIDHSTVTSGTELTAANFINTTTAPGAISSSKYGYYSGSDRCISAILTDGSNNILKFYWNNNIYIWDAMQTELSAGQAATFTDVSITSSVPNFGNMNAIIIVKSVNDQNTQIFYRVNGSADTVTNFLHSVELAAGGAGTVTWESIITTDSSQVFEYYITDTGGNVSFFTKGFYLSI